MDTDFPYIPNGVIKIAADSEGDVIFHAIRGDFSAKMLVSSRRIGRFSPVFRVMFNGQWAEARQISLESPGTCTFRDNPFHAFLYLCILMHRPECSYAIKEFVKDQVLRDFTSLCDKYDCAAVGREQARIWVNNRFSKHLRENTNNNYFDQYLIWVSYVFDLWEEFNKATIFSIVDTTYSCCNHPIRDDWSGGMPSTIKEIIIDGVTTEIDDLIYECEEATMKTVGELSRGYGPEGPCHGQLKMTSNLIQWLGHNRLWYSSLRPEAERRKGLLYWRSSMPQLPNESWLKQGCHEDCMSCNHCRSLVQKLPDEIRQIIEKVEGLCLDHTLGQPGPNECRQCNKWVKHHELAWPPRTNC